MSEPTTITLIGSTGLTGSATLTSLLSSRTHPFSIRTFTRKSLETASTGHGGTTHINQTFSDLFSAAKEQLATPKSVYISCLGTTRAQAGGFEQQKKVDWELNRDLAKKAREDGASTAILVSSGGADSKSLFGYPQIKGQLEDDLIAMDYEHTVILRPGLLLGSRNDSRWAESMTKSVFSGLTRLGLPMQSLQIQDTDVGDCIAYCATNPSTDKVKVIGNSEMIQLAQLWRESQQGK